MQPVTLYFLKMSILIYFVTVVPIQKSMRDYVKYVTKIHTNAHKILDTIAKNYFYEILYFVL